MKVSHVVLPMMLFLISCAGPQGDMGASGAQGLAGAAGAQGAQGSPGLNASGTAVVLLCPKKTALCVDSKLYVVRSDEFILLAPGFYDKDDLGLACNLTVHANCVVSH